jgi:hypothetical protein
MNLEQPVGIGYFDSESGGPAFDEAVICPACGLPLTESPREVLVKMIHCSRWPLGTFFRIHRDELPLIGRDVYLELVCRALELRARQEQERRTDVPSSFLNAFKGENA